MPLDVLSDVVQPHRIASRMWRGGSEKMKDTVVFRSEVPSSDMSAFLKSAESARDYFNQYGKCELVWEQHSPCNRNNTRHTIVLRFGEAAASNRVKQKYNGRALYGARITTSWLDVRQMNELGMNKKGRQGTHASSILPSSSSGGTRSHGDHYLRSKERTSSRDKDREPTGKHDSSPTPEVDRPSTGNGSPSKEIVSPTSKTHTSSRLEQKRTRHSSQSSNSSSREGRAMTPIIRGSRRESSPPLERRDRPESRASGHSLRETTWSQSREFDSERRRYSKGKRKHEDGDSSVERTSRRHSSPSRSHSSRAKRSRQDSERKSRTTREERGLGQEDGGKTRSPLSQSESVSSDRDLRPSSKCSTEKEGDMERENEREMENEAVTGKSVNQQNSEGLQQELSEEPLVAEMESGRDLTIDSQPSVERGHSTSPGMESHLQFTHVDAESSLLPMEADFKRETLLDIEIERGLYDIEMKKEVLETWEQQQMYSINATEDFPMANLDDQPSSAPLPPVDNMMVATLGAEQLTSHDPGLEGDVTPPLSEIGTPVHFPDFSQMPVFSGDAQDPTAMSQAVMSSEWPVATASQECAKRQRRIGVDAHSVRQSILDEFDCNAAVLSASCKLLASHNPESSDAILSSLQSTLWKVAYSLAVKFDEKMYQ